MQHYKGFALGILILTLTRISCKFTINLLSNITQRRLKQVKINLVSCCCTPEFVCLKQCLTSSCYPVIYVTCMPCNMVLSLLATGHIFYPEFAQFAGVRFARPALFELFLTCLQHCFPWLTLTTIFLTGVYS